MREFADYTLSITYTKVIYFPNTYMPRIHYGADLYRFWQIFFFSEDENEIWTEKKTLMKRPE